MDLFSQVNNETTNLLPADGLLYYYGSIMPASTAHEWLNVLLHNIAWKNDEVIMFGKRIVTKRKSAWYGSQPFNYTYSKITRQALPWTPALMALKNIAEEKSGETYNSCLLNLYHDGNEGMAWHSDAEKELKENGAIASMSFGAVRKFSFKHKRTNETISIVLEHGSLLVMKGATQKNWLHRLPPAKRVTTPRVNLTFRTIEG